ncbi:MAG: FliI/YscN family ATPase [Deltaproteobacteria bacterium]|nr:FliI/YscN family ATPase [Deltaproteobacteria bacterium]
MKIALHRYYNRISATCPVSVEGQVTKVVGNVIEGNGPAMPVGGICQIMSAGLSREPFRAEVIGFRDQNILLMPLERAEGVEPGSSIKALSFTATIDVGENMLGRVLDGLGIPLDGRESVRAESTIPLYSHPVNPLLRNRIVEPLTVGVRSIDCLNTLAKGQRAAIMAGSGVGKSKLLGMMSKFTKADVNVIALIGERGREVKEFIERDLGAEGLKRSVVIAATSDTSPLIRMRGAYLAAAIAEFFREKNMDVLLMMDSITRFAMAAREVGLSAGEPPTSKAYPPSTFSHLPKLLERAGTSTGKGSITGIYTVLVEGDDMNEPIADAVRSIVDGHIVLDRSLAAKGHYPAVNVLSSISRLMSDVVKGEHLALSYKFRRLLADYAKIEDLVNLGAYEKGNNRNTDYARDMIEALNNFLRQDVNEGSTIDSSVVQMTKLLSKGN